MRGLDTNVLLRLLTADDPLQHALARSFFEDCERRGELLFVSAPVLCELIWALKGPRYRLDRATLADILEQLLERSSIVIDGSDLVRLALRDFRRGAGDFADYLIGRLSRQAGCSDTVTFDAALSGEGAGEGFTQLSDRYPTGGAPSSFVHEPP